MTSKLRAARDLATSAHSSQTYGGQPYTVHLGAVVAILERYGFSPGDSLGEDVLCGGWLHDTLEDTSVKRHELEDQFGARVSEMVWRVTDEPGSSRAERKALTYPKIRGHFAATVVKLADRIANVEASLKSAASGSREQFDKYLGEQPKFRAEVFVPMLAEPMWAELDSLFTRL